MKTRLSTIAAVVVVLLSQVWPAAAQDSLDAARQLYTSASYDEALSMLDRLKLQLAGDHARATTIDQYRAFCLLAVGRQPEAERAVEAIIDSEPAFRPEETASPRLLSVFRDVRKRVLPTTIRQRYETAKGSFDRKAYAEAVAQFDAVLALLESPDVLAADSAFADLRTVVRGFRDLATVANTPPPAAPAEPPAPAAPPAAPPPPSPSPAVPARSVPAVFSAADAGVTLPVVVREQLPPWPKSVPRPDGQRAVLDTVIDQAGRVESVVVRPSLGVYDGLVAAEAKGWLYKPALKDGAPVRFRRMVQIVVGR
jgi:hypothetical protein